MVSPALFSLCPAYLASPLPGFGLIQVGGQKVECESMAWGISGLQKLLQALLTHPVGFPSLTYHTSLCVFYSQKILGKHQSWLYLLEEVKPLKYIHWKKET